MFCICVSLEAACPDMPKYVEVPSPHTDWLLESLPGCTIGGSDVIHAPWCKANDEFRGTLEEFILNLGATYGHDEVDASGS